MADDKVQPERTRQVIAASRVGSGPSLLPCTNLHHIEDVERFTHPGFIKRIYIFRTIYLDTGPRYGGRGKPYNVLIGTRGY